MDFRIEQWINGPAGHSGPLDAVMVGAALGALWVYVAVVVLWFAWGWWRGSAADRLGAIAATGAAVLGLLVNKVIGLAWDRPRPFVAHPALVHLLASHARDASFPSDDATGTFAIAVVLFAFHRGWGTVALIGAVLVCYARVFVGFHYPSDVLAGAAIGTIAAVLAATYLRALPELVRRVVDAVLPPRSASRLGTPAAAAAPSEGERNRP